MKSPPNLFHISSHAIIYARIRLQNIFVLHDGHHVRSRNRSAIHFRRLATLQVGPRPIIVHVLACHQGGGFRNCQSRLPKERQETCCRSCRTRGEHAKSSDIPDATSLFFDHVTLQGALYICACDRPAVFLTNKVTGSFYQGAGLHINMTAHTVNCK